MTAIKIPVAAIASASGLVALALFAAGIALITERVPLVATTPQGVVVRAIPTEVVQSPLEGFSAAVWNNTVARLAGEDEQAAHITPVNGREEVRTISASPVSGVSGLASVAPVVQDLRDWPPVAQVIEERNDVVVLRIEEGDSWWAVARAMAPWWGEATPATVEAARQHAGTDVLVAGATLTLPKHVLRVGAPPAPAQAQDEAHDSEVVAAPVPSPVPRGTPKQPGTGEESTEFEIEITGTGGWDANIYATRPLVDTLKYMGEEK